MYATKIMISNYQYKVECIYCNLTIYAHPYKQDVCPYCRLKFGWEPEPETRGGHHIELL